MARLDIFQKLFARLKPQRKVKEPAAVAAPAEQGNIPVPSEPIVPESQVLAITCIGYSHIKHGTVCQDSSLCHREENFRLIAVSDGHGSSSFPRSDRGSRLACDVAKEVCAEFIQNGIPSDREQAAFELCSEICRRWKQAVLADYGCDPFDDATLEGISEKYREHYRAGRHVQHAYGATLIAVLDTPAGTLAIRCGDGECLAIDPQGNFSRPIPWNEKCDVNVTTSLCDADAIDEFRWAWLDGPMAAIWIGTDGLDNSYSRPEDLEEFYANLSARALDQGYDHVLRELEQFLPVLTQRCSQDDISVAAMITPELLTGARDRLHAYVELCQALREQETLQRRLKLAGRTLREKERALEQGKGSAQELYSQIAQLRQEIAQLEQNIRTQETKLAQLRLTAGR